MKTSIHLIRHGLTAANKNDVFAGRTSESLIPEGMAQFAALGARLSGKGISKIFCGPLLRTHQSAIVVGEMLAVPVESDAALNEIHIPHWDGLTKAMIRERFGSEYPMWCSNPAGFVLPGCETIADVQRRAVSFLEKLFCEYAGQNVLVVTHLIVVRALLLHYLGRPVADFREIKVGNAQVTTLLRDDLGTTVEL